LAAYRPFTRQWAYLDRLWNDRAGKLERTFPTNSTRNHGFVVTGVSSHYDFCCIAVDAPPNLHTLDTGQFFPRWLWEPVDDHGFDFGGDGQVVDGYRRVDNITDEALQRWQAVYGLEWTKDDVFFYCYGLLHSPDYRETYAADLKKSLPRIPLVESAEDARVFAAAGQALSKLHVGYESVKPYPLEGLRPDDAPAGEAAYDFFAVGNKRMRFGKPTPERKAAGEKVDRSVIHYNDRIKVSGIPEDAYRYQLGSRSAVEWIIDRYYVKTDKASGIVNDPNDWSREVGDPRYILDLLARVVTVSVETMRTVDALPALAIRQFQSGEQEERS
jgi:predicted helicase